ncbi:MAG: galactose ABC transporter substrate-binding protein [Lachnospiraceae bacterium]|nr:galactose ABC transporter substrate-binding protein [Lachnospiraceae bacterium]MBO5146191.1 galactose ABC transporter substrate-binding protein [Lachnospiraceae bacterium]
MKRRKMTAAAILLCIGLAVMHGCGKVREVKSEKLYLGVACYNASDTFLSEWTDSLRKEIEALDSEFDGAAVTIADAAGSQRTQDDQVKALIDSGCNVLCINLVDRADPSEIIDLAKEYDVPIIFFNREPVAEDMMQWDKLYYVGADAKQSGIFQGELAAEAILADSRIDRNHDGIIQYIILEGEPGHQDALIRTENAVDTLKSEGILLEKVGHGIANWNRVQAQNRMQQFIDQHQNKIELVIANNDDMALGAIDAYQSRNLTESSFPVFFGIDGTSVGLEAVREGVLAGTVYNDAKGQAEAVAKLSAALVSGTGMEDIAFTKGKCIYLPYSKVTADNVDEYINMK